MIDSHCHLAGDEFVADLDEVVARAKAAGVARAVVILSATDPAEIDRAAAVSAAWPEVRYACGVHPHEAGKFTADPESSGPHLRAIVESRPDIRFVGEIGLDYHYDFAPRDVQQRVFRAQIRVARELGMPIVIHTREAWTDTVAILADEAAADVGGIFHCFTGTDSEALEAVALGFHLSFSGIASFPKGENVRAAARLVPAERVLTETDSPFLAPVPYRGKRNEPAYVVEVTRHVAAARGESPEALAHRVALTLDSLLARRVN